MPKLPLFKTHYSLGRSILTAESPTGSIDDYPVSVFDLALHAKLDYLCVVEDGMTGFLQLASNCTKNNLKLIFGLRIEVTNSIEAQDEASLKNRAKYIIFARNNAGYQALIKIWSFAAKEGFYYNPCIDFKNLKRLWNDNLSLGVPFYDSFLHLNSLEGHFHIPEFGFTKPTFFVEDNAVPFDALLKKKVETYCAQNSFDIVEAQSIFYKSRLDYIAFATFRCICNRTTIENPNLNHLCSDTFNFEDWNRKHK